MFKPLNEKIKVVEEFKNHLIIGLNWLANV